MIQMLRLYLLGEPSIETPSGEPIKLDTSKHYHLLAYMWLTRDRQHRREDLAEHLWSPEQYTNPRANLKTALSDLGRKLNESFEFNVIDRSRTAAGFNPETPCWIDVIEFEELLDSAESSNEELAMQLRLKAVEEIYAGDFMAGCDEIWEIDDERRRLIDRYVDELELLADHYRQQKKYEAAIYCCKKMLAKKPLREEIYQDLIYFNYLTGDLDAAMQYYKDCERILQDVLQSEPSPDTKRVLDLVKQKASPERIDKIIEQAKFIQRYPELIVPYVGREREQQVIVTAWESAHDGNGSAILIGGEAGIGKTELAKQLLRYVRNKNGKTLWGACSEIGVSSPYQPWIEILREALEIEEDSYAVFGKIPALSLGELMKLMPELVARFPSVQPSSPLLQPEHEQTRIFEAITQALKLLSQVEPLFIFIDDLQWADESSIQYLKHLARSITEDRVLLVCSHRLEEIDEHHPLMDLIGSPEPDEPVRQIRLHPLETAESEELITHTLRLDVDKSVDFVPKVIAHSEGNPLYIVEILFWLVKQDVLFPSDEGVWHIDTEQWEMMPAPPGVEALIAQRLRRVGRRGREILDITSTRQAAFDLPFLQKSLFWPKLDLLYELEELIRVYLVQAHPRGYEFRHDLIRHVVYRNLKKDSRQQLHLKAGEAIELLYESGQKHYGTSVIGEMAHHFHMADEKPRALEYSFQAGDHAWSKSYSKTEALVHFERALELAEELEDEESEILALKGLGEVCCFTDEQQRGYEYCERGLEICEDPELRAEFYLTKAHVHHTKRELEDGLQYCEQALDELGEEKSLTAAKAHYHRSQFLNWLLRFDDAMDDCYKAQEILQRFEDKNLEGLVLSELGHALSGKLEFDEAARILRRAAKIVEQSNHSYSTSLSYFKLGIAYRNSGEFFKAIDAWKHSLSLIESVPGLYDEMTVIHNRLAHAFMAVGKINNAIEHSQLQLENALIGGNDDSIGTAHGMLGCLYHHQQMDSDAQEAFSQAMKIASDSGLCHLNIILAYIHLEQLKVALNWFKKWAGALEDRHIQQLYSGPTPTPTFEHFRDDPRFMEIVRTREI